MNPNEVKDLGDEIINILPNIMKDQLAKIVAEHFGDLIFEKGFKRYPLICNKEMFLKIIAILTVSMIRTHPKNFNVQDQQDLMVAFLKELEEQSNKLPYYSKSFETKENLEYIKKKANMISQPGYFDNPEKFKEQIRRDLNDN